MLWFSSIGGYLIFNSDYKSYVISSHNSTQAANCRYSVKLNLRKFAKNLIQFRPCSFAYDGIFFCEFLELTLKMQILRFFFVIFNKIRYWFINLINEYSGVNSLTSPTVSFKIKMMCRSTEVKVNYLFSSFRQVLKQFEISFKYSYTGNCA